ncbi:MAG: YdeI/OmpD-associated family protein [Bacteroidetes bacterium]|nr:YdeI/OmpD-associated family protein [Bacteroidota bacterium]MDA1335367.1 YdeI/OmpD-associated family protein [Bacteroidota bacterium]
MNTHNSVSQFNFAAQVKRFSMDGGMHYLELPKEAAEPMRATGQKRWLCTIQDAVTWSCGLLPTGEGSWFIVLSKQKMRSVEARLGDWLNVDLVPDESKYGMPLPEDLEEMLADDPEFERKFDAMLPGKRRNAIHQIASAKTPETAAKRIMKLMEFLGV